MIVFISGGGKSGKSSLAQDLTVALSEGKHYYIATMIPTDAEDHERIRLHIADRDGMGFETIECGRNILSCLDKAHADGAFLLDSATALLMNELFRAEKNYEMDIPPLRSARMISSPSQSLSPTSSSSVTTSTPMPHGMTIVQRSTANVSQISTADLLLSATQSSKRTQETSPSTRG